MTGQKELYQAYQRSPRLLAMEMTGLLSNIASKEDAVLHNRRADLIRLLCTKQTIVADEAGNENTASEFPEEEIGSCIAEVVLKFAAKVVSE